ncbi:MAG TPA: SPW repeat protein [Bradyrhizobium sp.]|nr:SPW repeat protein [Bradyrhizobium sp.]
MLDLYNVVLAVVLFAAPWLFSLTNGTARMDFWVSGVAVVAISLAAIFAYANWEEWANLLLGLWLIASPWVLGFSQARAIHFAIGIGVLMAFLALLELWLMYEKAHPSEWSATPRHQ